MSGIPDAIEVEACEAGMMKHSESKSPGVSLPGTIATLSNVLVGGSSVLLPYAFQLSGWCFAPLVLAVGCLMGFTLWIMGFLLESLDESAEQMGIPRSQRDWGFIGYAAFGNVGRVAFAGCMFVDLIGSALFLLSVAIEQLPFLLPFRHGLIAVLCCLAAFGCCLLPKRFFSAMAVLGITSQVILVVGILVTGAELSFTTGAASDQLLFKAAGIPPAVGIALLCFLAHSEAPLIYQMMADRTKWTKAVIYSMSVAEAFLLLFGGLGYMFFGGSVGQSIAMNIGRDLDLHLLPGRLVICSERCFSGKVGQS
ncbi:AVT1A [Symbiodinium sp. CCMP2456]|nr:AVT1A [Symbiodinium sp. CCMP2456]